MQVIIRHEDSIMGSNCGEMSPEELHIFKSDLKTCGIVDAEDVLFDDIRLITQFHDTGDEFFCEIIWGTNY